MGPLDVGVCNGVGTCIRQDVCLCPGDTYSSDGKCFLKYAPLVDYSVMKSTIPYNVQFKSATTFTYDAENKLVYLCQSSDSRTSNNLYRWNTVTGDSTFINLGRTCANILLLKHKGSNAVLIYGFLTQTYSILAADSNVFGNVLDTFTFNFAYPSYFTGAFWVESSNKIFFSDLEHSIILSVNLNDFSKTVLVGTESSCDPSSKTATIATPIPEGPISGILLPFQIGDLVVNSKGDIYFVDTSYWAIRKVSNGMISTIFRETVDKTYIQQMYIVNDHIFFKDSKAIIRKIIDDNVIPIGAVRNFLSDQGIFHMFSETAFIHSLLMFKIGYQCVDPLYTGNMCDIPITCNGTAFNDSSVCNGNGRCISPDVCSCDSQFFGNWCKEFKCFSLYPSNANACNGRGTCVAPNTCNCTTGHGASCQLDTCFGKGAEEVSVCSGSGTCISENTCSCYLGYYGNMCQYRYNGDPYYTISNVLLGSMFSFGSVNVVGKTMYFVEASTGYIKQVQVGSTNPSTLFYGTTAVSLTFYQNILFYLTTDNMIRYGNNEKGFLSILVYKVSKRTISCFAVSKYGVFLYDSYAKQLRRAVFTISEGNVFTILEDKVFAGIDQTGSVNEPQFSNGNGMAVNATMNYVSSIVVKDSGDVFILDSGFFIIRKINIFDGSIVTVSGVPGVYAIDSPVSSPVGPIIPHMTSGMATLDGGFVFYDAFCSFKKIDQKNITRLAGAGCTIPDNGYGDALNAKIYIANGGFTVDKSDGTIYFSENLVSTSALRKMTVKYNCAKGYQGDKCLERVKCFNIVGNDSQVCSGFGTCVDVDTCACPEGRGGNKCEKPICFNVLSDSKNVCSGRGICNASNSCNCAKGYFGNNCQDYTCFGLSRTSKNVCSSKGNCVDLDVCNCFASSVDGFWAGSNCSTCQTPYTGSKCFTVPITATCDNMLTCMENGVCDSTGSCACFGNFTGPNCNMCKKNLYGTNCLVYCDSASSCSGHGFCDTRNQGACSCFSDYTNGFFKGSSCDACQQDYYGPNCKVKVVGPAVLEPRASSISFKLFGLFASQNIPCNRVLVSNPSFNLGQGAKCYWSNKLDGTFVLQFGSNYAISLVNPISIRLDLFDPIPDLSYSTVELIVLSPYNPALPIAKIQTKKTEYGNCEIISMDGSGSFSGDQRPLGFHWRVMDSTGLPLANDLVSTFTDSKLLIPSWDLPIGDITVQLMVSSSLLNLLSIPKNVTIRKTEVSTPTISIIGKSEITTTISAVPLMIKKIATLPSCIPNTTVVQYNWRQISGPLDVTYAVSSTNLAILNFASTTPSTYVFEVAASLGNGSSSATVTIKTELQPLLVESAIESLTYSEVGVYFLVQDLDNSPETEKWMVNCSTTEGSGSCGGSINSFLQVQADQMKSEFSISRSIIDSKVSTFTLNFYATKGERFVSSKLTISFPPTPQSVAPVIMPLMINTARINPTGCLYAIFLVNINGDYSIPITTKWMLDGEDLNLSNTTTQFEKCDVEEGRTYEVVFIASANGLESQYSYSSTVNRPPNCVCSVSPSSGTSLESVFNMVCPNCQTPEQSYEISFGFEDSYTGVEVVLSTAKDNSFSFPLPSPSQSSTNVFVNIKDVSSGAYTRKSFTVSLSKPIANSYTEMLSLIDSWMNVVSYLQNGDPLLMIFNSVSIANAMKYLLDTIQGQQNTRSLRLVECSGHGSMLNGFCVCDDGYHASDCRFNTQDFNSIQKLKNKLFTDFYKLQSSRNSSLETISESILVQGVQGIQSFVSDSDFLTNNTLIGLVQILEQLLSEASVKTDVSISSKLLDSYQIVLQNIDSIIEKTNQKSIIDRKKLFSYDKIIALLYSRGQRVGYSSSSNNTFSQSITMKTVPKLMDSYSIAFTEGVSVILPSDLSKQISQSSVIHSSSLITDLSYYKVGSYQTIISQYIVDWRVEGLSLTNLTSRIRYEVPITKPPVSGHKIRSMRTNYSYSCYLIDEQGIQQDSSCSLVFTSKNTAQCYCNRQGSVFVVENVYNTTLSVGLDVKNTSCSSISIEALAESNSQTNFSYEWYITQTTSQSNIYLSNVVSNTFGNKVDIDTIKLQSGTYNIGVNVSTPDGQYALNTTTFEVKPISIVSMDILQGRKLTAKLDEKTTITPHVLLPLCYKDIPLVYSYTVMEKSVEKNVQLVTDNSSLLIGKNFTTLPKEGDYTFKLTVHGFNVIEKSIEFTVTTSANPLDVKFNISDLIQSVDDILSFSIITRDPDSLQDSESLQISCLDENGNRCLGVKYPIGSTFSSPLPYGSYEFIAQYSKGLRSSNTSVKVSVISIVATCNGEPVVELSNVNQMMTLKFGIEPQLPNAISVWATNLNNKMETSKYLVLSSTILLSSIVNQYYHVSVKVVDGLKSTETSLVFKLVSPKQINPDSISSMLNTTSTVTSVYIVNTLGLLSSQNTTGTESVKQGTNFLVTQYLTNISNKTIISTNETVQHEVSAFLLVGSFLNYLEDSTTSMLISQLESMTTTIADDSGDIYLDKSYLDNIKKTADILDNYITSVSTTRSILQFTDKDHKYIENIYLNLVRSYSKNSNPDDASTVFSGAGYNFYSRKALISSIKNGLFSLEQIDTKNYFSALEGFYNVTNSQKVIVLTTKTQPKANIVSENSGLFVSDIVEIMVSGIELQPPNPIASITFTQIKISSQVECLVLNNSTLKFEKDEVVCNVIKIDETNQTMSIQVSKPGTFVLSNVEIPQIEPIVPSQNSNLRLLGLLALVALAVCVIVGIFVAICVVCICKKKKSNKKVPASV